MFDINNSRDFYAKLLADFDDYLENQNSARHAMNCAITAHHMHDWIWVDFLKKDKRLRDSLGIGSKLNDFVRWIDTRTVWFRVVQNISNGSKHFVRDSAVGTERVAGYGHGAYGLGPYGEGYLAFDMWPGDSEARYIPVAFLLEVLIRFWRDFFRQCGRGEDLPVGKYALSEP